MNRLILFLVMIMSYSFFSFSFYDILDFNKEEIPKVDALIEKNLSKTLIQLQNTHPLSMIGMGGSQKNLKEETISISLALPRVLTKDQCRKLIVESVLEYLKDINDDSELKQYLQNVPFIYKNLELRIFLTKPDRSDIPYPNIQVISSRNGYVVYYLENPDKKYDFLQIKESFEEALNIIKKEISHQ